MAWRANCQSARRLSTWSEWSISCTSGGDHAKGAESMLTITAVIRARNGPEGAWREPLLDGARHGRPNEPDTVGFFISRDAADPTVFTTYERFTDRAAMDRHNGSDVVAKFFAIAQPILDGSVTLVTCE